MPVVMGIAVVVVIVAVVLVALGRGDGLSVERNDYLQLDLGPVSATDVALLRPPTGLWGYNMQATDEAMEQIAESIRERDVRIVALEQLITDLSREPATTPLSSPYATARHRRSALDAAATEPSAQAPARWTEPPAAPSWTERPTTASPTEPPTTASLMESPTMASLTERPTTASPTEPPATPPWPEPPPTPLWPTGPAAPADDGQGVPPEQSHD